MTCVRAVMYQDRGTRSFIMTPPPKTENAKAKLHSADPDRTRALSGAGGQSERSARTVRHPHRLSLTVQCVQRASPISFEAIVQL